MKCHECVKEEKRSCVYPPIFSGLLCKYYDEDGMLVVDHHNYRCSNGHKWMEKVFGDDKQGINS